MIAAGHHIRLHGEERINKLPAARAADGAGSLAAADAGPSFSYYRRVIDAAAHATPLYAC